MSGILAADECIDAFNAFKLQNTSKGEKLRYIIFRIKNERVVIDEKAPYAKTWDDFLDSLSSNEKDGAYGLYDFHAEGKDGRVYDKVIFVLWCNDMLPIRAKMLYGSTSESFKSTLGTGIAHYIQATSFDDLDIEDVTKAIVK